MKRSVNFDKLIKELETLKSRNQIEKSLNKVADAVNNGDLDPDILCKAKYIRREGSPGHYKYIYAEDQGSGGAKGKQQEKEVNKKTSESNLKYKKGDIVVVPGGKTGKIISYRKDAEHFTVDLGNGVKESYGEKDLKGEPKKESGSKKEEG
jgi:preprotein translocase subunit YajC